MQKLKAYLFYFPLQIFLPGQMTRIEEPDLLIDHDIGGGGGGCKRFLGGPAVEPFAYSGVANRASGGVLHKNKSGEISRKWFPFSSNPSPKKPCRTKETDIVSFSSSSPTSPTREKPTFVHNNNNNNYIIDMTLDENTRWPSSTAQHSIIPSSNVNTGKHLPTILPPPAVVPSSNHSGIMSSATKTSRNSNSSSNNHSKSTKHSKNSNSNNHVNNSNNKNNCNSNSSSSASSSVNNKPSSNTRINNCGPASVTTTVDSHVGSSSNHYPCTSITGDEDNGGRHLIIRYINCNERPNKKQLVTLGLISVIFIIILVILLALFLGPTSTLGGSSRNTNKNSKDNNALSDTLISSDIASSLNNDDVDLDDSESYDDGDSPYYSGTTSSTGLDLKKVSKLSWDLLNSNNQDSSSRGSSNGGGGRGGGGSASLPPLGTISSGGEGEIILPAKMIYTSSGDSTDLIPSEHGSGVGGGSQNKKRSCCRTQKYSQVIKRDGCEPLTIVNKMCFGQCVSVWVPGLFASFPVCRPSKSTFKTVTLTCGRNREKRKRVRIEKVRRCSCMEIEPTAASL